MSMVTRCEVWVSRNELRHGVLGVTFHILLSCRLQTNAGLPTTQALRYVRKLLGSSFATFTEYLRTVQTDNLPGQQPAVGTSTVMVIRPAILARSRFEICPL